MGKEQNETRFHQAVNEIVGSCENCKWFRWISDLEGGWCKRHGFLHNETFNKSITLDQLGCKQFEHNRFGDNLTVSPFKFIAKLSSRERVR